MVTKKYNHRVSVKKKGLIKDRQIFISKRDTLIGFPVEMEIYMTSVFLFHNAPQEAQVVMGR
jgi:hypothetical protein